MGTSVWYRARNALLIPPHAPMLSGYVVTQDTCWKHSLMQRLGSSAVWTKSSPGLPAKVRRDGGHASSFLRDSRHSYRAKAARCTHHR